MKEADRMAAKNFYVLAEFSMGLDGTEASSQERYWLGVFNSKLKALQGGHYRQIQGLGKDDDFGSWLAETQGEEFAEEWREYVAGYESRLQEAIDRLSRGDPEEAVTCSVLELNSPVERNYINIIASGGWPEVKEQMTEFLRRLTRDDDEDERPSLPTKERDLVEAVRERIERHNQSAY